MNPKKIAPIDQSSVHRICSGQVVLDLATAVKELVENALDANASVKLKNYGAESIEVTDNGTGIDQCNHEALCVKHTTSKLRSFADLLMVTSFGFRGEALSSLCAVGKVTVLTRTVEMTTGFQLEYDHEGSLMKSTPIAREVGTTILVQNIFEPLPVRHQDFMKHLKREYSKLQTVLQAYALISVGIKMRCINTASNGSTSLFLSTNGNRNNNSSEPAKPGSRLRASQLRENVAAVFGAKFLHSLKPIDDNDEKNSLLLSGFVTKVDADGRGSADRQFFFINRRPVDFGKATRVINEAYRSCHKKHFPALVLNLDLAPDQYDVNVVPNKRQVLLHAEEDILNFLRSTMQLVYRSADAVFQQEGNQIMDRSNSFTGGGSQQQHRLSSSSSLSTGSLAQFERTSSAGRTPAAKPVRKSTQMSLLDVCTTGSPGVQLSLGGGDDHQPENVGTKRRAPSHETTETKRKSSSQSTATSTMPSTMSDDDSGDDDCSQDCDTAVKPKAKPEATAEHRQTIIAQEESTAPMTTSNNRSTRSSSNRRTAEAATNSKTNDLLLAPSSPSNIGSVAPLNEATLTITTGSTPTSGNTKPDSQKLPTATTTPTTTSISSNAPETVLHQQQHLSNDGSDSSSSLSPSKPFVKQQLTATNDTDDDDASSSSSSLSSLSLSVSLPSPVKNRLSSKKKSLKRKRLGNSGSDTDTGDGSSSADDDGLPSPPKLVVLDDVRNRPLRLSLGGSSGDEATGLLVTTSSNNTGFVGSTSSVAVEPGSLIPEADDEVWHCSATEFDETVVQTYLRRLKEQHQNQQQQQQQHDERHQASSDDKSSIRFMANLNANHDSECAEELRREFKQEYFTQMKVIGQFNLGFIVAKLDQDLFLVDQHASDEKYNYEQLRANTQLKSQPLIIPQDLDLTGEEEEILMDHVDIFAANGFKFVIEPEKPPRSRVRLSAKPYSKNTELGVQDIHEIITLLRDRPGVMCRPSRIAQMLASRACRSSIMIGTALTKEEMETVLHHMSTMEQPFNCPHGRPTMRHMVNLSRLPNPNK